MPLCGSFAYAKATHVDLPHRGPPQGQARFLVAQMPFGAWLLADEILANRNPTLFLGKSGNLCYTIGTRRIETGC
jgi:hypothetical protein